MRVVRDEERELEVWREGVETLMYSSAELGTHQLTVFEQWCAPGNGAPLHRHAVEEVLRILSGEADVQVGDDRELLADGSSVIIPAGAIHGFRNIGDSALHVLAILAAPIFEAHYVDPPRDVRRWGPE
jgi:quercetin dioxygenase-like cupin family protein